MTAPWARRKAVIAGLAALACSLGGAVSSAAAAARIPGALGLLAPAGRASTSANPTVPVVYHGGPVMHGVTIHAVFWAPPGYRFSGSPGIEVPGYEAMVERFLADLSVDSGSAANAFSVLPEYADGSGPGAYAIRFDGAADAIDVADPFPARARCGSPAGTATCVTDAQLRAELEKVITAHAPGARGLGHLWLVFLPPDVDECITPGTCATNAFAGYHSLSGGPAGPTIYAPIPAPSLEVTPAPGSDPQGNPEAETAIDTAAHEIVEAMTDPTGVGWMDPNGGEAGDKCEAGPQYGTPAGFALDGAPYNQVIGGRRYLLQMMWSNAASGCVQHAVPGAVIPIPPEVDLHQFSPAVTGRTGIARRDIPVRVILLRAGEPVAVATAATRADGSWGPAVLAGLGDGKARAVGDDRDEIVVQYGQGGPPRETILVGNGGNPFIQAGWTGWFDLDNGVAVRSHGARGAILVAPCSQTGVLSLRIGATPAGSPVESCATDTDVSTTETAPLGRGTVVRLSSTDNRAVFPDNRAGALVRLTVVAGEPNSVSPFTNVVLPFDPGGFPTCTADLQFGRVACGGLIPGARYRLVRRRGRSTATLAVRADDGGVAHGRRFPGAVPLRGGDVVALVGVGRVLTRLHVARLRVELAGEQTVIAGGHCQPGEYYGPGLTDAPTSTSAIVLGVAGDGTVCSVDGNPRGFSSRVIEQIDDRSGGVTRTEVPLITDTAPVADETVTGPVRFLAGAGFPGPHNSVVPSGARIGVVVRAVSGPARGRVVFRAANVNTAGGVPGPELDPGVYGVVWTLRDASGDTRTVRSRFISAG